MDISGITDDDGPNWDENPDWVLHISRMQQVEKMLPDEPVWAVAAAQNFADVLTRIAPLLEHEDYAVLIGLGAMFVREGNKETAAGLDAFFALRRAGGGQ